MARTPDRVPGPSLEEETQYVEDTTDPTIDGAIRYVSGDFRMKDNVGVFNPRSAGTGISETDHRDLRQLIHFIDNGPALGFTSGAYSETLPAGDPFPTSEIWYDSVLKLKMLVELTITRNANKTPATEIWEMYDTDGTTVIETVTDTISYSGIFEISRTRVIA